MSELSESEITSLIDKFELNIQAKQWSEYTFLKQIWFKCLTVPEDEMPLEYVQTLWRDARKLYEANNTEKADMYHSAARKLTEYHDFDWKDEIVQE